MQAEIIDEVEGQRREFYALVLEVQRELLHFLRRQVREHQCNERKRELAVGKFLFVIFESLRVFLANIASRIGVISDSTAASALCLASSGSMPGCA